MKKKKGYDVWVVESHKKQLREKEWIRVPEPNIYEAYTSSEAKKKLQRSFIDEAHIWLPLSKIKARRVF